MVKEIRYLTAALICDRLAENKSEAAAMMNEVQFLKLNRDDDRKRL